MKKKVISKKKLFFGIFASFVIALISYFSYSLVTGNISFSSKKVGWDGVTVASTFSGGNGTKENPFQIKTPEEFMYFKELIEGDSFQNYQDKYYSLGSDIDFNNQPFSSIGIFSDEERLFKGFFDGNGHVLKNINIVASRNGDASYFGLFSKVVNASVQNLSIDGFNITASDEDNKVIVGTIAGVWDTIVDENSKLTIVSFLKNVAISNFDFDIVFSSDKSSVVGGLCSEISDGVEISNVYLNGKIINNKDYFEIYGITNDLKSNIYNLVCSIDDVDLYKNISEGISIINGYSYYNSKYYLESEEVSLDDIVTKFNLENNDNFYWSIDEDKLVLKKKNAVVEVPKEQKSFSLLAYSSNDIPTHSSGISDGVVYVNDLETTWNYYMGLNYTKITDGNLPTYSNRYSSNNLVEVAISYSGEDINNRNLVGHVSPTEYENKYIYYRYYPVENNSITIELIDNPFSARPKEKGFNGWATNYPGAVLSFDQDIYTRYVTIPVTNMSKISIEMYAIWSDANIQSGLSNINNLNDAGMEVPKKVVCEKKVYTERTAYFNPDKEYYEMKTVNRYSFYSGFYSYGLSSYRFGNDRFCNNDTCTYYALTDDKEVVSGKQYYFFNLNSGSSRNYSRSNATFLYHNIGDEYEECTTEFKIPFEGSDNAVGYYYKKNIGEDNSSLYYNNIGQNCSKVSCSNGNTYKLLQYYDDYAVNYSNYPSNNYYYLVTRDMNILTTTDSSLSLSNYMVNKPYTLTSSYDGSPISTSYSISVDSNVVSLENDMVIENINIYGSSYYNEDVVRTYYSLNANSYNLKIGRNVKNTRNNYYAVFNGIYGSSSVSRNNTNLTTYKVIVETGIYSYLLTGYSSSSNNYIHGIMVYGNDYDRVKVNNDNLIVYFNALASVSSGSYNNSNKTIPSSDMTIKSGKYGVSYSNQRFVYSTDSASGVYIGGRSTEHYSNSLRTLTLWGGDINALNGGPCVANDLSTNSTALYMLGGKVRAIYGGAATTTTYGNRIISITGGIVGYGVTGGSNAYNGGNSDGQLSGDTLVYIGGNAVIGDTQNSGTLFNSEIGGVFGAGNGRSGSDDAGKVYSSHIIIDGNAVINGNVYGGGNYGFVGFANNTSKDATIDIFGGTLKKNVYGGGNNKGSGAERIVSDTYINFYNGIINGSIFGGSRTTGTIYGNTNINVHGGNVLNDVYGGGEGNNTIVSQNVNVTVGKVFDPDTNISINNVYGGSAYGRVNGNSSTTSYQTIVNINSGVIKNAVFGGAKGDNQNTPYVYGNISVNVKGGNIGEVYGGFDARGNPSSNKTDVVVIDNGTIGNVFGGGRNTGQKSSDVSLNNGYITGSLYGGSNNSGTVDSSDVKINGGNIAESVFGGGNEVAVVASKISFSSATAKNVFGGSNQNGVCRSSDVTINSGTIYESVFGGNNDGGSTLDPSVKINNGIIGNVFGGGKKASSGPTDVVINDGIINDVFGGGNEAGVFKSNGSSLTADTDNSSVKINGGSINRVYGGSNVQGDIATSNIDVDMNDDNVDNNILVPQGISININRNVVKMEDWQKNQYPEFSDMKTYATIGMNIQNNTSNSFENLGLLFNYSKSVFLVNNYTNMVDIDTLKNKSFSFITKYNNSNLSLGSYGNIYLQFNMFSSVDVDEFEFKAEILQFPSKHINQLFGGNNAGGNVNNSIVDAKNSFITFAYGGGNEAYVGTSNITLSNVAGYNAFGGNNEAESTGKSKIILNNSNYLNVYGGGNNAINGTSEVNINSGNYSNVYGGGNAAESDSSNVTIKDGTIENVFGGGNSAGLFSKDDKGFSTLNITGGSITNVFGGSNAKGKLDKTNLNINIDSDKIPTGNPYTKKIGLNISVTKEEATQSMIDKNPELYDGKKTHATITVNVKNNTDEQIKDWSLLFNMPDVEIYSNTSTMNIAVDSTNGNLVRANSKTENGLDNILSSNGNYTFTFEVLSDAAVGEFTCLGDVTSPSDLLIDSSAFNIMNVYGGGNKGSSNGNVNLTNLNLTSGRIASVYGGGNAATIGNSSVVINNIEASDIYGGGNMAGVNGSTLLDIDNSTIYNNIYGGGNEGPVSNTTTVTASDSEIQGNAFAGGNGVAAIVKGNSKITIDGNTIIGTEESIAPNSGCVFGSGNAADNGNEADPALGIEKHEGNGNVNIVGGTIYGNVYGGAKMAVVYGEAKLNVGTNAVNVSGLTESHIHIMGSVFGGGESNASGSASYDSNAISVIKGINVNINGTNYIKNNHDFIINGSIFGSGNASSSAGDSKVYISYLGTKEKPNQALSIQRSSDLTIDSSVIELSGAKDRTNEYSKQLFSFNQVDILKLVNNSTLLIRKNANALKELYSGIYKDGELTPAVVDIDDGSKKVTKNVDNRIYILNSQNLNISTRVNDMESYGKVTGMTFFGMYTGGTSGYNYGLYDSKYSYGSSGNSNLIIAGGSYITGLRKDNHDITKDGFYSNFFPEDDYSVINTAYVVPGDLLSNTGIKGYLWGIGIATINYEVYLTASKFSSLGTAALSLIDSAKGNTTFTVLGFDGSNLKSGINLVDYNNVPRVGKTPEEANNTFGLAFKTETQEWTGHGVTKFMSTGFSGDNIYRTDNRAMAPALMFYLYHPKNIDIEDDLGYCTITLQAMTPVPGKDAEVRLITITVYLDAVKGNDVPEYDASIAYDKKYELPAATAVNITNRSQFSAYFSLAEFYDSFSKVYGKNNEHYHVLTMGSPLPLNTMITMIDYGANYRRPDYYYLVVTPEIYQKSLQSYNANNEADYLLSDFIKMDSVSEDNTYDDKVANKLYFDEENNLVDEEFIFIFDFKETNSTGQNLNQSVSFELRNSDNFQHLGVGKNSSIMFYSTYDSSNAVLSQSFTSEPSYVYYDVPVTYDYSTSIMYNEASGVSVIDTNYESSSMGVNISFIDKEGVTVSSSLLVGTSIFIDGHEYFCDGDGVFRIKLANKVSSIIRNTKIVVNKDLPAGDYKLRYVLFASDDGLHNSTFENSVTKDFDIHVVSSDNYISVDSDDKEQIVDGETSLNLNGSKVNKYNVKFSSKLSNQNFRIYVSKRNIDVADSNTFEIIPFNNLFNNVYEEVGDGGVYITMNNTTQTEFNLELADELKSGTYKVSFEMYDNNQMIDRDVKYVIVKKKVE